MDLDGRPGPAVGHDPVPVSLAEMAGYLHPSMSTAQLEGIIRWLPGFHPVGTGPPTGGRRARLFDAGDVQELHSALRRWL